MKQLKRVLIPLSAALAVTLAVVLLVAQSVQADNFTVDTLDDANDHSCNDGSCSLRDAIEERSRSVSEYER